MGSCSRGGSVARVMLCFRSTMSAGDITCGTSQDAGCSFHTGLSLVFPSGPPTLPAADLLSGSLILVS